MQTKLKFFAIPLVILLALAAAGTLFVKSANHSETEGDITQEALSGDAPATLETAAGEEEQPAAATAEAEQAPQQEAELGPIVVEGTDPKFPRALGKLDAPVTMYDFSSLTCPHCAHAHAQVIPQLIKNYVQTGKLRIVFNDFPLNAEALDASKVSRCMPEDKYFGFISLLFSTIDQWAANHPAGLIQSAVLAGMSADKAQACLADKDVEKALVEDVQKSAAKYNINATPTFVFNDGKKVIQGARQYIEFQMAIDGLIEEQKDAAKKQ